MRNLKPICAAVILGLALSIPAYAGNIHSPGVVNLPPPPPPLAATNSIGYIGTPGVTAAASEDTSIPDFVDVLLALFSLF
ncbi:MAG TPA: hypothetical protein VES69_04680 [Pyrinomonadaceae bacterium]|nr:hypothetical protein [Pyrinomonadaceae bacterium]